MTEFKKVGHLWGASLFSNFPVGKHDDLDFDFTDDGMCDDGMCDEEMKFIKIVMSEAFHDVEMKDFVVSDVQIFKGSREIVISAFPSTNGEYGPHAVIENDGVFDEIESHAVVGTASSKICPECGSVMWRGRHACNECRYGIVTGVMDE